MDEKRVGIFFLGKFFRDLKKKNNSKRRSALNRNQSIFHLQIDDHQRSLIHSKKNIQ